MGVPANEEEKQVIDALEPNMQDIDDNDGLMDLPRKKKMFSSSSFYEEPNAIYPTVEEQVEMCRKIADSLSDDCNKKSKGANMFFKRVEKAEKWVVRSFETEFQSEIDSDPSAMPYVRISKEPPKLKLILDPRHIVDLKRLREEGIQIVEHNVVSPDICHDLVKDLNSPVGKGAQLFAKRKKKSEEWVVDEERVRAHVLQKQNRESGIFSPEPGDLPIKPLTHPRVQMIKTPWDAAMESPIGSCDGAFKEVRTNEVVDSVIRAAEAKVMSYPSPRHSAFEPAANQYCEPWGPDMQMEHRLTMTSVQQSLPSTTVFKADVYKSRAPRGWTSFSSSTTTTSILDSKSLQPDDASSFLSTSPTPFSGSAISQNFATSRTFSFSNFNKTAKAWSPLGASLETNHEVKPVKPPSVLVQ